MVQLKDIKEYDVLLIRHQEIVPVDAILSKGYTEIDYSFITGESQPQRLAADDLIYAGGRVTGSAIEVIAVKDFNQTSFVRLWEHHAFDPKDTERQSRTTLLSQYFSVTVLLIALITFICWQFIAPATAWTALTAVLIVACPCALLLTTTFTNGYLMSFFAAKGFFLRDAAVIEQIAKTGHFVFDKTGTITVAQKDAVTVSDARLSRQERALLLAVLAQSTHPLCRAITTYYRYQTGTPAGSVRELPGKGMEAWIEEQYFKIGSSAFVCGAESNNPYSEIYVSVDGVLKAHYQFTNALREGSRELLTKMSGRTLSMISGDQDSSWLQMKALFPANAELIYHCSPQQKLEYIQSLQAKGENVMMIGDGLNDAGALQQSNVGIAVVDESFSFSPASKAILKAEQLRWLPEFIRMAVSAQRLIVAGFIYSLLFNIVGLSFAVTGHLSPLVAAILMPSSSLGIILIAFLGVKRITGAGRVTDKAVRA